MAASFFTGTYAELYTGSAAFSAQINSTPAAFGLTAPLAAAYQTLNDTYAAAYLASDDPSTRTKGQNTAKKDAAIALRTEAARLAKLIDGTATVTNQQRQDLGLNVRKTPSPKGPPGPCTNFKVVLSANGSVEILWKCQTLGGNTIYQVWRKIGVESEFTYLGGTAKKTFLDSTIPVGTSSVTYQLQAVRPSGIGPWSQTNVNFGVTPAGVATASVTQVQPTLKAA